METRRRARVRALVRGEPRARLRRVSDRPGHGRHLGSRCQPPPPSGDLDRLRPLTTGKQPCCPFLQEGAVDLLRELKAMPVTLHLLQSTRVGMSVNALRKQSSDEEVIALAKSLIKSWKKLLGAGTRACWGPAPLRAPVDASDARARDQRRGAPPPTSSSKEAETKVPRPSPGPGSQSPVWLPLGWLTAGQQLLLPVGARAAVLPAGEGSGGCCARWGGWAGPQAARSSAGALLSSCKRPELPRVPSTPRITTFPPVPVTCDAVRNKCREMLTAALQTGGEPAGTALCLGLLGGCPPAAEGPWDTAGLGPGAWALAAEQGEPGEGAVRGWTALLPEGSLSAARIFRDVGNTDMKYKNRVRSRIANLRDAKNPALRRNVLHGVIAPQKIAVMTSEVSPGGAGGCPAAEPGVSRGPSPQEMASDELKEIRKALTREAIREHQMARTGGAHTDLFTCGKCRKKNCTYTQVRGGATARWGVCSGTLSRGRQQGSGWGTLGLAWLPPASTGGRRAVRAARDHTGRPQVQTRSSDEPVTTFVVCNECGNRWK
ncbi:Transcription elongation factor A protein 2, partial [Galemys pyrenaicus]